MSRCICEVRCLENKFTLNAGIRIFGWVGAMWSVNADRPLRMWTRRTIVIAVWMEMIEGERDSKNNTLVHLKKKENLPGHELRIRSTGKGMNYIVRDLRGFPDCKCQHANLKLSHPPCEIYNIPFFKPISSRRIALPSLFRLGFIPLANCG